MNSAPYDILIRGATVVTPEKDFRADVTIQAGKIQAVAEGLDGPAVHLIEQKETFVLPGYVDAHVHLNEPGREEWEGFATGTRALAAGGCTVFADMPLNSTPVLDAASFAAKAQRLMEKSLLDGALWGGLVPGMHPQAMRELAECGVIGFKAFMSNSGMADFPAADLNTLRKGMVQAADLDLPVAVHAESDAMTGRLAAERLAAGRSGIDDYLESRPIEAELEAIGSALDLATATGCRLHIVHVSSAAGLAMIRAARARGCDVSAETCPHYLLLADEDVRKIGAPAKCAPPLRTIKEQHHLWEALARGEVDTIGSDHSPSPPELKTSANFFDVWGGIAGCQHNYPLLFEEAVLRRGLPAPLVARMTALQVAERFRLEGKGRLEAGADADLVVLQVTEPRPIAAGELLTRHQLSAYVDRVTRVGVLATVAGGRLVHGVGANDCRGTARILRPKRRL